MSNVLDQSEEGLRKLSKKMNFAKMAYEKRREAENRFEFGYIGDGSHDESLAKEIERLNTDNEYQDAALRVISPVDKVGVSNDFVPIEEY